MDTSDKVKIPENYRRSLSVTSHHIEKSINDIEDLLLKENKNDTTEKIIKNLDEEIRSKILELIKIVREENKIMFNELDLNQNISYEDRIVRSRISHIWTLLCDSTSDSLKGYGDVSKKQAELINKHVNSLLESINKIQSIIL